MQSAAGYRIRLRRRIRLGRELLQMFLPHIVVREQTDERGWECGFFNRIASVSFLPLHQAQDPDHFKAGFARRLNRIDGGSAGGANIVNDDRPRSGRR